MPNPYHDAEGRFCSAGEMKKAIDIAASRGDVETYFRLRTDYEAAQKDTLAVSRELFTKTLNSAHTTDLKTVEEIQAVTDAIINDNDKDVYHKSSILISVLENPKTPENIKQQIFETLNEDTELKNSIFEELTNGSRYGGTRNKILPQDITKMVETETNPTILKKAIQLDHLTMEQKVKLADRYPTGMAHLAEKHPNEIFSNTYPELKERFEQQAILSLRNGDTKTKQAYFNVIGEKSSNPELIHQALTHHTPSFLYKDQDGFLNDRYNPYGSYIKNPNTTPQDKLIALQKTGLLSQNNFKESLVHVLKENMRKNAMSPAEAAWIQDGYIKNFVNPTFSHTHNPTHTVEYEQATKAENILKANQNNMRIIGSDRRILTTTAALKNLSKTGYESYEAQYKTLKKENNRRRRKSEQQARQGEERFTESEIQEILHAMKQQSGIKEALTRYQSVINKK